MLDLTDLDIVCGAILLFNNQLQLLLPLQSLFNLPLPHMFTNNLKSLLNHPLKLLFNLPLLLLLLNLLPLLSPNSSNWLLWDSLIASVFVLC